MKQMIMAGSLVLGMALAACTPAQVETAKSYQDKIAGACNIAMGLTSFAPQIAPWVIGGCATEAAIAKLALDPSSLEWLNNLIAIMNNARRLGS